MWTTDQLTALEEAIAAGVLTVKYADRAVTYHGLSEMLDLHDRMVRDLAAHSGTKRPAAGLATFRRD